jgi:ATP-binding cassette subfamily F protein uup
MVALSLLFPTIGISLERVCDRFWGLLGDKQLRDLPRGVDQYLEQRVASIASSASSGGKFSSPSSAAEQRQLKKDLARVERQVEKARELLAELLEEQEIESFNPERLIAIAAESRESWKRTDKFVKKSG